jgi:hypothetical protein
MSQFETIDGITAVLHFVIDVNGKIYRMGGNMDPKEVTEVAASVQPDGLTKVRYTIETQKCDAATELEKTGLAEGTLEVKTVFLYPKVFTPLFNAPRPEPGPVKLDADAARELVDLVPEAASVVKGCVG